ncbi:MAG: hypothetical protein DMG30_11565 [Acidobacteria bacterium]|nr:MAG: hypothetical protein DMG30_11565 [Acidobacteriota bacterium]
MRRPKLGQRVQALFFFYLYLLWHRNWFYSLAFAAIRAHVGMLI